MPRSFGPLAPYLVGLYFVLSLAANSQGELVRRDDFLVPTLGTALVAAVFHLGAWLLTRDGTKAALIACVGVVAFATFGIVLGAAGWAGALGPTSREMILPPLYGLAGLGFTVAIAGARRKLDALLGYVAVTSALLVSWNGLLATKTLAASAPASRQLPPSRISAPAAPGRAPDVLLVILDKYSGSRTLATQYDFDNTAFENFLRRRGFLVPAAPRANYVNTFLALGAMLNVSYLDSIAKRIGPRNRNRDPYYNRIEGNRLAAFFRERGYRFVFLPTAYGATRQNRFADIQLPDPKEIRSEFVTSWYRTTPLPMFHRLACWVLGCPWPMAYTPETATMIDWKFSQLAVLPGQERPVFVLAHLTVPHEPYIYRGDCEHRAPFWPSRDDGADSAEVRAAYLAQIRCLNRKLETLITQWQARSPVPPVILLQADHGHGRTGRYLPRLLALRPAQIADRVSVFAAYLIPGADPAALPDTVTPINAIRFMLRQRFGADLPPLPDATYWSAFEAPNDLERVR